MGIKVETGLKDKYIKIPYMSIQENKTLHSLHEFVIKCLRFTKI